MAEAAAGLLRRLDAVLLAGRSATPVLEQWCSQPVAALRTAGAEKALPNEHRRHLALMLQEHLAYRHVELVAGGHILCEADNWYVPERLTAAMKDALENTDRPFGRIIASLDSPRVTLYARTLRHPSQEIGDDATLAAYDGLPWPVLEHQALLMASDGRALSLVHEVYMNRLLAAQCAVIPKYSDHQASR